MQCGQRLVGNKAEAVTPLPLLNQDLLIDELFIGVKRPPHLRHDASRSNTSINKQGRKLRVSTIDAHTAIQLSTRPGINTSGVSPKYGGGSGH